MIPHKSYLHAPASTREAFPEERAPALFGPFRAPSRILGKLFNGFLWIASVALLAAVFFAPQVVAFLRG